VGRCQTGSVLFGAKSGLAHMKKIFSFNKFFISFCIFFILVWIALQVVVYMRMVNTAQIDGAKVLAWSWPNANVKSTISIYDTKVIKKDHNDVIIKIFANQTIEPINPERFSLAVRGMTRRNTEGIMLEPDTKCAVTLTYYRTNKQWLLGKVECQ
jgi:hypothetical protein